MICQHLPSFVLFSAVAVILNEGCTHHAETMKTDSANDRSMHKHESHSEAHVQDHGGSKSVELILHSTPKSPAAGEPVKLDMMLHDSQKNMLKDFDLNHGKVEFDVHFPRPGIYKLWGQFQRSGRVYTLPTVIEFTEHP